MRIFVLKHWSACNKRLLCCCYSYLDGTMLPLSTLLHSKKHLQKIPCRRLSLTPVFELATYEVELIRVQCCHGLADPKRLYSNLTSDTQGKLADGACGGANLRGLTVRILKGTGGGVSGMHASDRCVCFLAFFGHGYVKDLLLISGVNDLVITKLVSSRNWKEGDHCVHYTGQREVFLTLVAFATTETPE